MEENIPHKPMTLADGKYSLLQFHLREQDFARTESRLKDLEVHEPEDSRSR